MAIDVKAATVIYDSFSISSFIARPSSLLATTIIIGIFMHHSSHKAVASIVYVLEYSAISYATLTRLKYGKHLLCSSNSISWQGNVEEKRLLEQATSAECFYV